MFSTVESQIAKVGDFDALLCAGAFLPTPSDGIAVSGGVSSFFSGTAKVPVTTFFVDTNAVLLQAAPHGCDVCENIHFLGGYGIREISGLRVAYLSGLFDDAAYARTDVDFVGEAFTSRAVDELLRLVSADSSKGVDVLLTSCWPSDIERGIKDQTALPPDLGAGEPSWRSFCAPALAELCQAIEPRYHVFGSAGVFYQRPPFQTPGRGHVCRCIGLGKVGGVGKQRKWLHALSLNPMEAMTKDELRQLPPNATPCPFQTPARPARELEPGKRRRIEAACSVVAPSSGERPELLHRALTALRAADQVAYRGALEVAQRLEASLTAGCSGVPMEQEMKAAADPAKPSAEVAQATAEASNLTKTETKDAKEGVQEVVDPKQQAAAEWLERPPRQGVVRYTFRDSGPLGMRFSKDTPPWVLEVRDGSLAARKAPRVPVAGVVIAINGYEILENDGSDATKDLLQRPVVLDVQWPHDQPLPSVSRA